MTNLTEAEANPMAEISDENIIELTPTERLIIHIWRKSDHSINEMIATMFQSGTGSTLNNVRKQLADILGIEDIDKLPRGDDLKPRRMEIEGMIYRLALDYHGITKAPSLKAELKESDRKKYDRAFGLLQAQFTTQVNRLVEKKLEAEVLRRLPDEERRYIEKMKEAMAAAEDIWFGMPQLKALYDAFQPFLENDKLMMRALHPDRAPPERREEFSQAMSVFNRVRDALDKISTTHRRLLEHIWPIKR